MLGFDADERGVRKMPERYGGKVVWGSRYPNQDTMSAWEAIDLLTASNLEDAVIAQMMGGNAAQQFGIELVQAVGG
jgi:hypothetical protein